MPIRFACPTCGATLNAPEDKVGARVACPRCKNPLQVPPASQPAAPTLQSQAPLLEIPPSSAGPVAAAVDKVSKTSLLSATCPYCDAGFPFSASALGGMYQCPRCNQDFPLPLKGTDVDAFLDNIRQERLRQADEHARRQNEDQQRHMQLSQASSVSPQDTEMARQGTCPNCAGQGVIRWKYALADGSGDPNYADNRLMCGHCQWEEGMAILNSQRRAVVDMLERAEPPPSQTSQRGSRAGRSSSQQTRGTSNEAHTVAILMLIGGIFAIVGSTVMILYFIFSGIVTMGVGCICMLWPGPYYGMVVGIMATIEGSRAMGGKKVPAKGIAIMQIINIINCDVVNLAMGILGLVFLNKLDEQR